MLRLTVSYGGDSRRHALVEGRSATVGASPDNDLVAPFPGVSRHHARVETVGGAALLVDLGSKNGLVVGAERRDRVVLQPGDRVLIGRAVAAIEAVALSDLELAVDLESGGAGVAGSARRAARNGETAPHWALHLVRELETLAAGATEVRRTAVLARIAEAVGAVGLWTFAVVEGDLFLRDCVGAVPSEAAVGRIGETVLREEGPPARRPVELADPSGWTLICSPAAGAAPVLVTVHPPGRRPEPWAADLLIHLAERLRLLEGEPSSEDLPALVRMFLVQATARYGKRIEGVGRRALELLQSRRWDGRLRELEHAIEGAVLRCPEGGAVEAAHFAGLVPGAPRPAEESGGGTVAPLDETLVTEPFVPLRQRLEEAERTAIREALERSSGDRGKAARLLRVSRESLDRRIARLGPG
jgi:hypothetical protein